MSHFFTLVVTNEYPTKEILNQVMQPFHQYECTGIEDQYVVDVDVTEKAKKDYQEYGKEKTFKDFLDGWYGANQYSMIDGNVFVKTNPNYKWDWWMVGGRYTGILGLYNPKDNPKNWEKCFICSGTGMRMDQIGINARQQNPNYTCNGCMGEGKSLKWSTEFEEYKGDICQVKDVDFDALRAKNVEARFEMLKEFCSNGNISLSELEHCLRVFQKEHDQYKKDSNVKWNQVTYSEKAIKYLKADVWRDLSDVKQSLVDWANSASTLLSFAVNDNGKWLERGEMGWWGVVSNEDNCWEKEYGNFLKTLKPNQYLTVVDCHI